MTKVDFLGAALGISTCITTLKMDRNHEIQSDKTSLSGSDLSRQSKSQMFKLFLKVELNQ